MLSSSKGKTMNTFKEEVNKIILALTSVGIVILLMLPASLSAHHYRYGTMSWEPVSDNGTHITIRLKMQNGWTANHGDFRSSNDYNTFVSGYVGSIKEEYQRINWGAGTANSANPKVDFKVLSRDNSTNDTITEMGDYSSGTWTTGVTHAYPDN